MGRSTALILVCAAAACLSACQPPARSRGDTISSPADTSASEWPFVPSTIRVHPLSRITVDAAGRRRVELRIECRDTEGDSVRTIGLVEIRMGDGDPREEALDLNVMRVNQETWDRVTRTYRQTLDIPNGFVCKPGAKLPIKLVLRLSQDRVLSATGDIACP
ncbi:MAG: hypothetical protein FJ292_09040 [Planctomycetes bacterium]|nr:hypothetical protein [Planctomycetota bacterium]